MYDIQVFQARMTLSGSSLHDVTQSWEGFLSEFFFSGDKVSNTCMNDEGY